MWRPGEEEEMGMPLVSMVEQPVNGTAMRIEEDDCDWVEEEVFDHGYEDVSDADETGSEGSFNSESGEVMGGDHPDRPLLFPGRDMTGTYTYHTSSVDHPDYEEQPIRYGKALSAKHEKEVSSRNNRSRVYGAGAAAVAAAAAADVSSSGTSSDVSLRGGSSASSSSTRGGRSAERHGVDDGEISTEARVERGAGVRVAVPTNSPMPNSRLPNSTARFPTASAGGRGGACRPAMEDFSINARNARSNFNLSTSSSAALGGGGHYHNGRCGLVENFGVGGAPIGTRMCGSSAADISTAAATTAPAAAAHGGGGGGGFADRHYDYPSLSSPRMQSKWLGVVRSNNSNNNTRPKAIPGPNAYSNAAQSKGGGLSLFGDKRGGVGAVGGGAGGGGGAMTKNDASLTLLPKWRQSAPVNFSHVGGAADRKIAERRWAYSPQSDDDDVGDNDWNNEIRIYPHELVAMNKYSHKMVAFSVADGRGGTLKGRELRRLRDLVLRQVMGYETRYPDGTLHELVKPAIALNVMD